MIVLLTDTNEELCICQIVSLKDLQTRLFSLSQRLPFKDRSAVSDNRTRKILRFVKKSVFERQKFAVYAGLNECFFQLVYA